MNILLTDCLVVSLLVKCRLNKISIQKYINGVFARSGSPCFWTKSLSIINFFPCIRYYISYSVRRIRFTIEAHEFLYLECDAVVPLQVWLICNTHISKKNSTTTFSQASNGLTGAHLGGIHPLLSNWKVSLERPFAPKMSNKGLKWPKMPCLRTHIPYPALILDAQLGHSYITNCKD